MYIPDFWCGVIATVGFEIIALVGVGCIAKFRKTNTHKK